MQAHWDAKVVRQPVQIETELISNGSDGLAYGDTLEMTAVVNVQPTDAKWSIRWQYSLDGEHFEDVEGANRDALCGKARQNQRAVLLALCGIG